MKRQNRSIYLNWFSLGFIALCLTTGYSGFAQLNVWTNSAGGKWEDPSWSLGAPGDTAVITNAGSKTILVGPSAWTNDPDSLNVRLELSAPPGSTNRLLIAPGDAPIRFVARTSTIGPNGVLENQGAYLFLPGETHVNGTLIQQGGILQSTEFHASGTVLLANVLSTNSGYMRTEAQGEVVQRGGTNDTGAFPLSGTYRLINGAFSSSTFQVGIHGAGTGQFLQSGGRASLPDVEIGTALTNGYFVLSNGFVRASNVTITGRSELTQYGGNLTAKNMMMGVGWGGGRFHQVGGVSSFSSIHLQSSAARINGGAGVFDLYGGSLKSGGIYVGGSGRATQGGGHLTTDGLTVEGWQYRWDLVNLAYYDLNGGTLVATNESIRYGRFRQTGGNNIVANSLRLSGLYGFYQNFGGSNYELLGGSLSAPNIEIDDRCVLTCAGAASIVRITNKGTFKLDGFFNTGGQTHRLGVFILSADAGDFSEINLGGTGVLRFVNSSRQQWTPGAKLRISGWGTTTNGSGGARLFFGTNTSGLTHQQLAQIEFSGHPAEILNTGEVVPWKGAELIVARAYSPNGVQLIWRKLSGNVKNFEVLRAPDASGPFSVIARVGASATNYFDVTVHSGVTYYYAIRSIRSTGGIAQSASLAVTLPVGLTDNLVFQHTNGQFSVWVMQNTNVVGYASLPRGPAASSGWRVAAFADLNADRNTDIVWQNNSGALMTWLMRGTNLLRSVSLASGPPRSSGWLLVGAPDLSGDRQADLLWRNRSGANRYWEMNQTNLLRQVDLESGPGWSAGWQVVAAVDVNRDIKADLIWSNTNGTDAAWLMDRAIHRETVPLHADIPRSVNARLAAVLDLNADRNADLVWENGGQLQAWLMQGTNAARSVSLRPNRGAVTGWRLVGPR